MIFTANSLYKRVEDQISKRVKGNYERGPISNFKFQEDEVSLEIQESCGNGWKMKELTPLEVLLYYALESYITLQMTYRFSSGMLIGIVLAWSCVHVKWKSGARMRKLQSIWLRE